MSFGRGLFSDFFEDDPFERMDRMMNSMFDDAMFGAPSMQRRTQQNYYNLPVGPTRPVIEEVNEPSGHQHHTNSRRDARGPIVEEPDDDGEEEQEEYNINDHLQGSQHRYTAENYIRPPRSGLHVHMGGSGVPEVTQFGNGIQSSFSYSSSTSYGGSGRANPVVYSSSSTTRIGPGGVRETTSTMRDGRTGQESITIARALGDRGRTITRTRDAQGYEESRDLLNNIDMQDASAFDAEWMNQAQHNLMDYGPGRSTHGPARSTHGRSHHRLGYR